MRCVHLPHLPCNMSTTPTHTLATLWLCHFGTFAHFALISTFLKLHRFIVIFIPPPRRSSTACCPCNFHLVAHKCCCMPLRATEVISWQPVFLLHYLPVTYSKFMAVTRATSCQPANRLQRWKHPFVASLRFIVVVHNNIRNFWVSRPSVRWVKCLIITLRWL